MIPEHRFKDFLRDIRRKVRRRTRFPAVGNVQLGSLDRVTPVSSNWGFDRGQPVDRYYIENFLDLSRDHIAGRVLEVANNTYTRRFGGNAVTRSDILHDAPGHSRATVVADLSEPEPAPANEAEGHAKDPTDGGEPVATVGGVGEGAPAWRVCHSGGRSAVSR